MSESPKWKNFNKTNVKAAVGDSSCAILAVRRDGKGHYGFVESIGDNYVELSNGSHRQNLYYTGAPMQFVVVELPPAPTFKLGNARLL